MQNKDDMNQAAPITLKCKICGGDIFNDYLAGASVCAHCGNRWSIEDLIPDYSKYSRIITGINKARDTLNTASTVAATNEANLMYRTAISECGKINDAVSADLLKICNEGREEAGRLASYIRGKDNMRRASYDSAVDEFKKIPGYKDSDSLIEQCKAKIIEERRKGIPWAVVFSLILPAILAIFLKEKLGMPLGAVIPIFLVCSAGLGYVLYRGGIPSIIIKIISFLCAAPLILFMILAYVFHIGVVPSAIIAVGIPIVLFVLFAILTEQKN
ncbi:MAG: hypothetical protein J6X33_07885 [Clostridiales bacterium]|nr:hypothetical protein [Clostridiales bacterium]